MKTLHAVGIPGSVAGVFVSLALIGMSAPKAAAADNTDKPLDKAEATLATYTWSAELVTFDQEARTVTVKSRFVENPESASLSTLHEGDHAMLTWSGLSTAAGVRAIERGNTSRFDRMTMPVEFVSSEPNGRYISFKVPIPAHDSDKIAKLSPGDWVTATSPLSAKNLTEAVASIRPYTDVG
jgi:hypothetical protein